MKHFKFNTFALVLITFGIIMLLGNLKIVPSAFGKLWPLLLIAAGIGKIINSLIPENKEK